MIEVPARLGAAVVGLFEEGWRERKAAVGTLLAQLDALAGPELDALCRRLLDGLVAPDAVEGRAACQEVLVALGTRCVPHVLERIGEGGPGTRLLVDLLGVVGDSSHVPLLVELVSRSDDDSNVRASAATALGVVGGEEAIAALVPLLTDSSEMLRAYAIDALRTAGARVPVATIEPLLSSSITRKGAAALLALTGSVDALPLLLPALADRMSGVRAVAAVALADLEARLADNGKGQLAREAIAQMGPEARARVPALVRHRDRAVSVAALRVATLARMPEVIADALAVMDDPALLESTLMLVRGLGVAANTALADLATDVETGRREQLFRLVGALEVDVVHPRLAAMLVDGLTDPNEGSACAAAEALRYVGGRASMAALYRSMDHDGSLGELAAEALAEISNRTGRGARDDLTLIVGGNLPQEGPVARNLCRVFGRLADPDYVPQLVGMLGATSVDVRISAAQALGQIPGEHEGVGALTFALADEEPQVRASACRSLGQLLSQASCQSLLSATSDSSAPVRTAAVSALVVLGNPVALPRLREIVTEDPVPTVIVHAIEGLGASTSDQDMTMLMSLCLSEDHEVVKAAARALTGFAAHRATAALLGLLVHPRWDVRSTAADSLAARGDATALEPIRRALSQERDDLVRQELQRAQLRLSGSASGGSDG